MTPGSDWELKVGFRMLAVLTNEDALSQMNSRSIIYKLESREWRAGQRSVLPLEALQKAIAFLMLGRLA